MYKGVILIGCVVLLCLASTSGFASEAIARKYQEMGGPPGPLGAPVTPEYLNPDGIGQRQHYQRGSIYWSPATGAYAIMNGPLWDKWAAHGWEQGLGYPATDEIGNPDGIGQRQHYQRAAIYWSPTTGAYAIMNGPLWDKWAAHGWEQGLGYPVTDEIGNPDGIGRRQHYQRAAIYWSPATGAHVIFNGPTWNAWAAHGWEQGRLGYPTSDAYSDLSCGADGRRSNFENGSMCWTPTGGVVVYPAGDTTCLYGAKDCSPCVNKLVESIARPSLDISHRDTTFRIDTGRSGFQGSIANDHNQGVARLTDVIAGGTRVGRMILTDNYSNHGLTYAENRVEAAFGQDTIFSDVLLKTQYRMPIRTTYDHPGGAQAHGNTVAIGMEGGPKSHPAAILFIEFPPGQQGRVTHILKLDGSHGELVAEQQKGASAAAFVKLCSGRFLLAVSGTNHGHEGIWFYESFTGTIDAYTGWRFIDFWQPPCSGGPNNLGKCFGGATGMALLTDCSGDIYLSSMHGTDTTSLREEYQWIQVYRLQYTSTGEIDLSLQHQQRDATGNRQIDNPAFRWTGGAYVTENHGVIVYNTERRTKERDNSHVDGDVYFSTR